MSAVSQDTAVRTGRIARTFIYSSFCCSRCSTCCRFT